VKRRLVVEATGGPLARVMAGANAHATRLLAAPLAALGVTRPPLRRSGTQQLDPTPDEPRFPARRGVVERTLAGRAPRRAVLRRSDTHAAHFRGLLPFACALL
jgi:hypothetical protein